MRKKVLILISSLSLLGGFTTLEARQSMKEKSGSDSLPRVFQGSRVDLIYKRLRWEGSTAFQLNQLPMSMAEWKTYQGKLRERVIEKAGVQFFKNLPLEVKETGSVQREGYAIKNILFQTRPGVYATANLYVPDGKGPFPAVLTMHGHWPNGKTNPLFQSIGHTLALNGYVCLVIDTWGSGERTSVHGVDEYHGSNLGASVLNLGETLLGVQVSDNLRGVDLLTSLPYVDRERIGVTGASGGGNQTMWLMAIDERIKAAMPVVSVGTFDSYIMEDNCVCEVLPDGLTFTEESGILALAAPRALKICNVNKDPNPTFVPAEMLRSYQKVYPVYELLSATGQINYQIFDEEHTYSAEMREHLLGWMDFHLKRTGLGERKKEIPFQLVDEEKLMVFPKGKRDSKVETIRAYCERRGKELTIGRAELGGDAAAKKEQLSAILRLDKSLTTRNLYQFSSQKGWQRLALETSGQELIPVLFKAPSPGVLEYVVIINPKGKDGNSAAKVDEYVQSGKGVLVADLWGTGEAASAYADAYDQPLVQFHTLSRAKQWLGKSVLGEWVAELNLLVGFIQKQNKAARITIDGNREGGLAGLFYSALQSGVSEVILRESPVSYVFDNRGNVDFYGMSTQLVGFLKWGDLSVVAALSNAKITFIRPLTSSGRELAVQELTTYRKEFEREKRKYKKTETINFKE